MQHFTGRIRVSDSCELVCSSTPLVQGCLSLSDVVEVYAEMWSRKGKGGAKQALQRKKALEEQVSRVQGTAFGSLLRKSAFFSYLTTCHVDVVEAHASV